MWWVMLKKVDVAELRVAVSEAHVQNSRGTRGGSKAQHLSESHSRDVVPAARKAHHKCNVLPSKHKP